jgi:hypothetical protein
MLRAGAANPACPPDVADQVLTWLALGGAAGDPSFDPVACSGNPGTDQDTDPDQWYWREARHSWSDHSPLWRVRAHYPHRAPLLTAANVERLRRDPSPVVRRNLFRFQIKAELLCELLDDEDELVRTRAAYALKQAPRQSKVWRMRPRRAVVGRLLAAGASVLGILALTIGPQLSAGLDAGHGPRSTLRPTLARGPAAPDPFTGLLSPVVSDGVEDIAGGIVIDDGPVAVGPDAEVVVGHLESGSLVVRPSTVPG